MEKFTALSGQAAPLLKPNVDTDILIRIDRLAAFKRAELGPYAFEAWRYLADGSENPDFVLNNPDFRGSPILLAGPNFGCGSSREHAVWALWLIGIRCVIAPSFGDIFYGNCFQNGMLPVVLPEAVVKEIAAEVNVSIGTALTVNLETQCVIAPSGRVYPFPIDAGRRTQLLEGLDDIALTLHQGSEIESFETADHVARPWIYTTTEGQSDVRQ